MNMHVTVDRFDTGSGLGEISGADGATYDLGSWRLAPGRRIIFTSGIALTEAQIKNLQITQPNGPAILALGCSASSGLRIAS